MVGYEPGNETLETIEAAAKPREYLFTPVGSATDDTLESPAHSTASDEPAGELSWITDTKGIGCVGTPRETVVADRRH